MPENDFFAKNLILESPHTQKKVSAESYSIMEKGKKKYLAFEFLHKKNFICFLKLIIASHPRFSVRIDQRFAAPSMKDP